jgi:hypothetical protein
MTPRRGDGACPTKPFVGCPCRKCQKFDKVSDEVFDKEREKPILGQALDRFHIVERLNRGSVEAAEAAAKPEA